MSCCIALSPSETPTPSVGFSYDKKFAEPEGSASILFDYCEPISNAYASSMEGNSAERITSIISLAASVKPSSKASSSVTATTSLKASIVF